MQEEGLTLTDAERVDTFWGECDGCGLGAHHIEHVVRDHYAICELCKTYWWIGRNRLSGWREFSSEDWKATKAKLVGYRNVRPRP